MDKKENNKKKVKNIIKTQIEAINFAKKANLPIVFIEYEGAGDTNSELKKAVQGYSKVKTFLKNTDGMFNRGNKHRSKLVEYLESAEIGNLIITGANGGACVHQSIDGSLEENYNVLALNTAIADFNYKDFIYPYNKKYSFNPTCEDCKFKDLDSLSVVSLNLTTNRYNNIKKSMIDGARDPKKKDLEVSGAIVPKDTDSLSR